MHISWLGQGCFKIKGKDATVVTGLYDPSKLGFKLPALKADISIKSDPFLSGPAARPVKKPGREESPVFEISSPGEYEVKGVFVYGAPWASRKDGREKTVFRIEMEGISMAHVGKLKEDLEEGHLDRLSGVDILIIPAGGDGKDVISAKKAVEITKKLEPKIIIPSFYKTAQLKNGLKPIDAFFKEGGFKMEDPTAKLKITRKDLSQEQSGARVVLLKI